jgi:hypothetical protein
MTTRSIDDDETQISTYVYRGEMDYTYNEDGQNSCSHVQIHFSVKSIRYEAFIYCQSLATVHLHEGLQVIEQGAFAYCEALTTVDVPSTVKVIQDMAFVECTSLKSVTLSDALQVIGQSLFDGCTSLKHVQLPRYLKTIKESSFCRCQSLQTLHLPVGLKGIGDWALADCYSLSSITVPSTVERVGRYCFQNCISLLSIELPEGLQFIGDHCFVDCSSLINLVIPTTFEFAGAYPLLDRSKLKEQFRGTDNESYEDEALVQTLCHRFDDLPIHNLCYHLPHYDYYSSPSNPNLDQLKQAILPYDSTTLERVDAFGMTPFHLLALSGTPNLEAFHLLLLMLEQCDDVHVLYAKDTFGCTAMDYLCRNPTPETKSLIEVSMESTVKRRLNHLGLEPWRLAISTAMDKLLQKWEEDPPDRIFQLGTIHYLLAKHERLECISLLESLLWKLRIETSRRPSLVVLTTLEERQHCRISCGADIVIPNVLSFLVKVKEKDYSTY